MIPSYSFVRDNAYWLDRHGTKERLSSLLRTMRMLGLTAPSGKVYTTERGLGQAVSAVYRRVLLAEGVAQAAKIAEAYTGCAGQYCWK